MNDAPRTDPARSRLRGLLLDRAPQPRAPREPEIYAADLGKLLKIGMAALFSACVLFAGTRLATQLATGRATPWWVDAGGAVVAAALYAWFRGRPAERVVVTAHASAVVAVVVLVVPAAYGVGTSKWWLALVGFAMMLMGRRLEAVAWSVVTLAVLPLVALLEGRFQVPNAIGESVAERTMSILVFAMILLGITWAHRRVAQQRARELTETAASLERANRVKSRFLAHMSHEIRTPLHGVIAMTDLALQQPGAEHAHDQIQTAQQSARTLLDLLNNVLDVTRGESDALVLERQPFALHATLTHLLQPLAAQARARGLALVAGAGEGVVEARVGDSVRLGQIALNLLTNAVKFTERGQVALHLEAVSPGRIRITVSDTGVGIPAERLAEVFEPFVQASVADHRVQGGVGLGLAIVRDLARRMGGSVRVESEPGQGTTFTVELELPEGEPRTPGPRDLLPARPRSVQAPPRASSPGSLSVLVCEDNPVNQKVVVAMLAHLGHRATVAADGLAAWARLEEGSFDVVLTDVEMPGLSGLELVERIRAREAGTGARRVPVIGATAHVGEAERHRLLEAGMNDHLGKPFNLAELARVLDRARS